MNDQLNEQPKQFVCEECGKPVTDADSYITSPGLPVGKLDYCHTACWNERERIRREEAEE